MSGALSPPIASTASVNGPVTCRPEGRREPDSDPDSASQRLACRNDLAPAVVAAMPAHVVRTLQLAAIGALHVRLVRQRLVAAAHPPAGRGGFSLRYGHGRTSLQKRQEPRTRREAYRVSMIGQKRKRRRLAERPLHRNGCCGTHGQR